MVVYYYMWLVGDINLLIVLIVILKENLFKRYWRESVWMWMKWNVKMSWVGIFMFVVRDGVICCLYFIVDFF